MAIGADSLRMSARPSFILSRLAHGLRPSRFGTRCRVMGTVLLVLTLGAFAAMQQTLSIARENTERTLKQQTHAHLDALSHMVVDASISRDFSALESHVGHYVELGHLLYVSYDAPDGYSLRRQSGPSLAERPDWFARLVSLEMAPIHETLRVGNTRYGVLTLQPSTHSQENFLWHLATRLFVLLVVALGTLAWLTHLLLKINLKDLARLQSAARRIEAGDYSARLPISESSPPELRETIRAFNYMSSSLDRLLTDLNEQQKALDSTAGVTESDLAGTLIFANELFCRLSGYPRDELIGQRDRLTHSDRHDDSFHQELSSTLAAGRTWRGELCHRTRDGQLFWTETTIIPIKDDDGLPLKYLSIHFDLTQRKLDEVAINNEKHRWQVTLQSINDAVIVTDPSNRVIYLNPTAESLLGVPHEEGEQRALRELIQLDPSSDDEGTACLLSPHPTIHGRTGSARLRNRMGQLIDVSFSCAPLAGQGGNGAIYVLRDETEKKQLLDGLREMAFHDTLTTLPNRRAVEGRLGRALRSARDAAQQNAFCYIDLDQFKLVNDTCGHAVGDGLLVDIAKTMKATLPEHAYLGRLGGDEFGLILFDTLPDEAIRTCRLLVQRIRDFRFEHKGRRFTLGACAGIAPITHGSSNASDIMVHADMACYRAKSEGSGRVVLYEADEVGFRRIEAEMGWAADFAQALDANQFLPYRQLIAPAAEGGQPHYEVLIRWQRNGTIEGPAKLLPALERYGQAPTLDRWMVESVIAHLAAQPDDHAVYFINLSGKTVADDGFLGTVCYLLDRYGVDGSRLGFEVTETAAVVNLEDAQRLIHGLRERGCRFALDDFGRDASSFFYLKHLPADFLKIDGAFVRGMLNDRRDQAIVRSITHLARDFGMHSVAEQVEDADMAALLREMGVDYLQGYHIHRPEPFPNWQAACAVPLRGAHLTLVKPPREPA